MKKCTKDNSLRCWIVPALFVLCNFVLKILFLNENDIALDEPFSIYHAQMGIADIIRILSKGNNPPLFEIILHFWIKLVGISAFAVRFLPMLFSVFTVLVVYKLGLKFFNFSIAVIASLLFTFSNTHYYFSHETRVYTLFALLTVVVIYAFLSLIKNPNSFKHFILFTIANSLLVYAHFFGFFVLGITFFCFVFFTEIRQTIFKKYLLSLLLIFVAYLPYLSVFFQRFSLSTTKGTWVQASSFEDAYNMLRVFTNAPVVAVVFLSILLIALVLFFLKKEKIALPTKVILTWFLLPFFTMFFISLKFVPFNVPMFLDRYLLFLVIGFYFTMAIAIHFVFLQLKYGIFIQYIPVFLMLITFKIHQTNNRNVLATIEKLKEIKTANAIVYFSPDWFDLNFLYYYNKNYFQKVDATDKKEVLYQLLADENVFPIKSANEIDSLKFTNADKIIFLDAAADFAYPDNQILTTINTKKTKQEEFSFPQIFKLYVFK